MNQSRIETGHLTQLDGLRGIAILMVMAYHIIRDLPDGQVAAAIGFSAIRLGWAGVDLFFVLSGFLIVGILIDSKSSSNYYRNFYIRRALRLFPVFYLVLIAITLAGLAAAYLGMNLENSPLDAVDRNWINFLYLTNFAIAIKGSDYVPLDIAWSLAVEEQMYLIVPLAVRFCTSKQMLNLLIGLIVTAPIFRLATFIISNGAPEAAYVLLPSRMDAIALGGVLAILIRDQRYRPVLDRLASLRLEIFLPIIAIVFMFIWTREDLEFVFLGYTVNAIAACALLIALIFRPRSGFARLCSSRWLVYTGVISYGLYLFHLIARAIIDLGAGSFLRSIELLPAEALIRISMIFALSFVMAALSYKYFERPILSLKTRFAPIKNGSRFDIGAAQDNDLPQVRRDRS